jgi:cystathionine beta-lyase
VRTTEADPLDTLRRRSSEKWGTLAADVLPMFVAEMDFPGLGWGEDPAQFALHKAKVALSPGPAFGP